MVHDNDPPPPDLPKPNKLFCTCGRLPSIPPRPKPAVSGPDCSTWIFLYRSATSRSNPTNDPDVTAINSILQQLHDEQEYQRQQLNNIILILQHQNQQFDTIMKHLLAPPPPQEQLPPYSHP
ncbi:unnamed protein product [Adineta steineri]|uniref:Uncharacterized protein n=1 Tax=Adineta steineri TaxID=433720 RepID=A0A813NCA4_9BILA|nr:unnamed protein product [Adineta steineri]